MEGRCCPGRYPHLFIGAVPVPAQADVETDSNNDSSEPGITGPTINADIYADTADETTYYDTGAAITLTVKSGHSTLCLVISCIDRGNGVYERWNSVGVSYETQVLDATLSYRNREENVDGRRGRRSVFRQPKRPA